MWPHINNLIINSEQTSNTALACVVIYPVACENIWVVPSNLFWYILDASNKWLFLLLFISIQSWLMNIILRNLVLLSIYLFIISRCILSPLVFTPDIPLKIFNFAYIRPLPKVNKFLIKESPMRFLIVLFLIHKFLFKYDTLIL